MTHKKGGSASAHCRQARDQPIVLRPATIHCGKTNPPHLARKRNDEQKPTLKKKPADNGAGDRQNRTCQKNRRAYRIREPSPRIRQRPAKPSVRILRQPGRRRLSVTHRSCRTSTIPHRKACPNRENILKRTSSSRIRSQFKAHHTVCTDLLLHAAIPFPIAEMPAVFLQKRFLKPDIPMLQLRNGRYRQGELQPVWHPGRGGKERSRVLTREPPPIEGCSFAAEIIQKDPFCPITCAERFFQEQPISRKLSM